MSFTKSENRPLVDSPSNRHVFRFFRFQFLLSQKSVAKIVSSRALLLTPPNLTYLIWKIQMPRTIQKYPNLWYYFLIWNIQVLNPSSDVPAWLGLKAVALAWL
jgi:hypothetical protein